MAKFNYELDATLLPEVWITWENKDGRLWANSNGKRQNHPESWMYHNPINRWHGSNIRDNQIGLNRTWMGRDIRVKKIWFTSGSQLYYTYAKYHRDIDAIELAAVKYDTTRSEHKHEWKYDGERFFITKDKQVYNANGELCTYPARVRSGRGHSYYNFKEVLSAMLHLNTSYSFVDEFKAFIGANHFIIGNGTVQNIEDAYHFVKWYESKQKTRSNGKAQQFVDMLVKKPLGEVSHLTYKYPPASLTDEYDYTRELSDILYFERVDDEWSVLRALARTEDNKFDETWRVYIGDDGTNRIVSKSGNDWVPANQNTSWRADYNYYFANPEEAEEKCNRIKYILSYCDLHSINTIITTLRFPIIEQMYKMGYTRFAERIVKASQPKSEIKELFAGYYKEKENGILKQVGMNKHQLDTYYSAYITNSSWYRSRALNKMRNVFDNNLRHLDDETFDNYFTAFETMFHHLWGEHNIENLNVDKPKFWKNLVRLGSKNVQVYQLVSDTISTYTSFRYDNSCPEVDWLFDSYSDIVRTHDALVELRRERDARQRAYCNMQEAERLKLDEQRRQKVDEKRKCYEYEDDEFIIRLPKDNTEIVNEGSMQRICIGGYTARHSNGETNLFFLRKKNNESSPFYAIEMNNDKRIVQIHGYCNRWLGNNPEAIPTVVRWLRKNGIECDTKILTCTSVGYGRGSEYITMPVVD